MDPSTGAKKTQDLPLARSSTPIDSDYKADQDQFVRQRIELLD